MLQAICIGNLGSDAEVKSSNGKEFTTFRIAHTEKWTDDAGQVHENTIWVDCIMNGKPNVVEYLKRGQQVYVAGSISLRVYSSAKDRCMKAGLTINVRSVELLGGKKDDVPSQLIDNTDGKIYNVKKWFHIQELAISGSPEREKVLQSRSGQWYGVDGDGWVSPMSEDEV